MDFSKIRSYLFIGSLILVTILFFALMKPFALPIFWAGVLAALFHPLFVRVNNRLKRANLSAAITLVLATIAILLPLSLLSTILIRESVRLYGTINDNRNSINTSIEQTISFIQERMAFANIEIDKDVLIGKISEVAQLVINFTFKTITSITQNSVIFVAMFLLMLYTLFFFLRDGQRWLRKVMHLCPLGDAQEIVLYKKFTTAANATLKGSLLVGLVQGTLGGILFGITGIGGAVIWGIIMTLLSVVPGVGSAFIWLPAAIIMLILGNTWQGITILIVGALLISTIDNFLRPILVGKDIKMPPVIILFSTLGGIALFGISGFAIGPIIASLFLALWEMYEQYYRKDLDKNT